jgi:hypothetical protein
MAKLHRAITSAFETLAERDSRERALRQQRRRDLADDPSSSGEREVPQAARAELDARDERRADVRRRSARTLPSHEAADAPKPVRRQAPTVEEVTPKQLHERALVALSQQRFTDALRHAQLACHGAPDNPDFVASSIWIRACMPQPDLKVLSLDLDDLLLHYPTHIQARYYRGVLRRRLGYDSAAKQDFERVVALDPDHAGAKQHLTELSRPTRRNG